MMKTNKKKALEVMAGIGRNVKVLKMFFPLDKIELLEACPQYVDKCWETGVSQVHHKYLHMFATDFTQYGLVLGVWALCYLNVIDINIFLDQACKADTIVLVEPVLKQEEDQRSEKWHDDIGQQMVIRSK